jgi:DNA-binding transcriptional ArsR family regulator
MIFIETSTFSRQLEKLRGDHLIDAENYRDLQNALLEESTRIDRIRGTGGLQKARWKTLHGGASGGLRVNLLLYERERPLFNARHLQKRASGQA